MFDDATCIHKEVCRMQVPVEVVVYKLYHAFVRVARKIKGGRRFASGAPLFKPMLCGHNFWEACRTKRDHPHTIRRRDKTTAFAVFELTSANTRAPNISRGHVFACVIWPPRTSSYHGCAVELRYVTCEWSTAKTTRELNSPDNRLRRLDLFCMLRVPTMIQGGQSKTLSTRQIVQKHIAILKGLKLLPKTSPYLHTMSIWYSKWFPNLVFPTGINEPLSYREDLRRRYMEYGILPEASQDEMARYNVFMTLMNLDLHIRNDELIFYLFKQFVSRQVVFEMYFAPRAQFERYKFRNLDKVLERLRSTFPENQQMTSLSGEIEQFAVDFDKKPVTTMGSVREPERNEHTVPDLSIFVLRNARTNRPASAGRQRPVARALSTYRNIQQAVLAAAALRGIQNQPPPALTRAVAAAAAAAARGTRNNQQAVALRRAAAANAAAAASFAPAVRRARAASAGRRRGPPLTRTSPFATPPPRPPNFNQRARVAANAARGTRLNQAAANAAARYTRLPPAPTRAAPLVRASRANIYTKGYKEGLEEVAFEQSLIVARKLLFPRGQVPKNKSEWDALYDRLRHQAVRVRRPPIAGNSSNANDPGDDFPGVITPWISKLLAARSTRKLGQGSFGVTYLTEWHGRPYVRKTFTGENENGLKDALIEQLNHIFTYDRLRQIGAEFMITMPILEYHRHSLQTFAGKGAKTLFHALRDSNFTQEDRKQIGYELALVLAALHFVRVAHLDLSSVNMLVVSNNTGDKRRLVLIDLGMANVMPLTEPFNLLTAGNSSNTADTARRDYYWTRDLGHTPKIRKNLNEDALWVRREIGWDETEGGLRKYIEFAKNERRLLQAINMRRIEIGQRSAWL